MNMHLHAILMLQQGYVQYIKVHTPFAHTECKAYVAVTLASSAWLPDLAHSEGP